MWFVTLYKQYISYIRFNLMGRGGVKEWVNQPKIRQILISFTLPKTPREIEKELHIRKLKIKPFIDKGLLKSLNPYARKGRLYVITKTSSKLLNLPNKEKDKNWEAIGWVVASSMQRAAILRVTDSEKRTSEELRIRALKHNQHLTRISTKSILKDLIAKELVNTEMTGKKRYYWLSDDGMMLKSQLEI